MYWGALHIFMKYCLNWKIIEATIQWPTKQTNINSQTTHIRLRTSISNAFACCCLLPYASSQGICISKCFCILPSRQYMIYQGKKKNSMREKTKTERNSFFIILNIFEFVNRSSCAHAITCFLAGHFKNKVQSNPNYG